MVVRGEGLFDPPWDRSRRAEHIVHRMAFVQAVFDLEGREAVTLHRGLASVGSPAPPREDTFVSATFSLEVAKSMMGRRDASRTGVLLSQEVPVSRIFMTYLETAHMNHKFREAEAVLFREAGNAVF